MEDKRFKNIIDMDESLTPQKIADAINNHEYKDLADYVRDLEWDVIDIKLIIFRRELRHFTKSIHNKDKRRLVMHYLWDNADYYFRESVENYVLDSKTHEEDGDGEYDIDMLEVEDDVNEIMREFNDELKAQLRQLEDFGEKDIVKLNRLQEKVDALEKELKICKEENVALKDELEHYRNPGKFGKYIPNALDEPEFYFIMQYLASKKVVIIDTYNTGYGPKPLCYFWRDSETKALFGYLVDRISHELDLRKNGRLNWKLFKPAFKNYDEIVKQGKDAVSGYKYWSEPQKELPENYHLVEEAIDFAVREMDRLDIHPKNK